MTVRRLLAFISMFFAVGFLPAAALAAALSFSAPASVSIGETFSVDVIINSADRAFNAAEAFVLFPTNLLEVTSVDPSPSATIFNFWLYPPYFSNDDGRVYFAGGTTPGVVGPSVKVLTVHFRAKGIGDALITASDASVNASDGSGANILSGITASRITVMPAPITIPEPASAPASTPAPAATTSPEASVMQVEHALEREGWEALSKAGCSILFTHCSLESPTITSVSVERHSSIGADIVASGTALDGDHLHLLLTEGNMPYKEVTALITAGRTWKARLSDITAYDTYALHAWVESADNTKRSELFTWWDVGVYPPFTLSILGYAFRWYELAALFLGALASIFLALWLWQRALRRHAWLIRANAVLFGVCSFAFLVMLGVVYVLWQGEHTAQTTYWKDTTVPCLPPAHADDTKHGSAELSIAVDGVFQLIPANVGISPECVADIHTHDDTGRLHLHLRMNAPRATLADFFAVAGEPLQRAGYTLSVTVNGADYTDQVNSYKLQDGDVIAVNYTSIPKK